MAHRNGRIEESIKGTPQGGVISPLLANLYLHFAFDAWMGRTFPGTEFERYADDIIIHCKNEEESQKTRTALEARLSECGLTLHPEKTKVVYCRDGSRKGRYPTKKFTFLGYQFEPRPALNSFTRCRFTRFLPAAGDKAAKRLRDSIKAKGMFKMHHLSVANLAAELAPQVRGWYQYFKAFYRSALFRMNDWLDQRIGAWLQAKYRLDVASAWRLLLRIARQSPQTFVHWGFRLPGRAV